jgi:hypothetical protein
MPKPQSHELKCWIEPFTATVEGRKTHEFRMDDRGFRVGDTLVLREWDPCTTDFAKLPHYTGRIATCLVTYISREGMFGIPAGYVVMSIHLVSVEL